MQKHCYIFAAGDLLGEVDVPKDSFIIAADAGYLHAKNAGIIPDLLVGDFDSMTDIPSNVENVRFPAEKDYTDTELAINLGIEKKCTDFVVLGAIGGNRLEHTIANLQLACGIAKKGYDITLTDGITVIKVLHNGAKHFDENKFGYISVFSFDGIAKGVSIRGLKYELDNAELSCTGTLGVSNEFIGSASSISVKDGTLIIIYRRKDGNFDL